jgi:hypothetical protein
MRFLAALLFLICEPAVVFASGIETTHLFGFTLGTDINHVGEAELELETTARFAKTAGRYSALSQAAGIRFVPVENFSVLPAIAFSRHDITSVPGLDNRQQFAFEALAVELRYRLLDRRNSAFGLAVGIDPRLARINEVTGEPATRYAADLLLIADREIVRDRLFAAFNLSYGPGATRARFTGAWEHESAFALAGAVTALIHPGIFLGAEIRYLKAYEGLALDRFAGHAVFAGPTLYANIGEQAWISSGWSVQVAGRSAADGGSLDLANFERHQVKFRLGYNF